MATWADLFDASIPPLPKQVFLSVGEVSSMVWETVNATLHGYDFFVRVQSPEDFSYSMTGIGSNAAYLCVDPDETLLAAMQEILKGAATEAIFVIMSKVPTKGKEGFEVLKKKAQASKLYYTISAPKTEGAQDKMVSFFLMRWGVTRDTSYRVCQSLDFSPGDLYQFDKTMMLATGGRVLPSSQTQAIVSELLGVDSPNTVVSSILDGKEVTGNYDEAFSENVLNFLLNLTNMAKVIQGSWLSGTNTVMATAKDTGISQFLVLRTWPIAEGFTKEQLDRLNQVVLYGLKNVRGNPEVLSVVSRALRG